MIICEILPVERPNIQYILATSSEFVEDLLSRECRKIVEGLICGINEEIGRLAEKVIEIMDSIVPSDR